MIIGRAGTTQAFAWSSQEGRAGRGFAAVEVYLKAPR
jgi:hypothetical protein